MTKKPQSMHGGGVAVAAGASVPEKPALRGRGVEATDEQARAIICTAKRAVEAATAKAEINGDGAAAGEPPLMKRSLQCFLEGRKKKATSSDASRCSLQSPSTSSSSN